MGAIIIIGLIITAFVIGGPVIGLLSLILLAVLAK